MMLPFVHACWRLMSAVGLATIVLLAPAAASKALPAYEDVKARYRVSEVLILDRHAHLLQRVRTDFHERRGDWVGLDDISPALQTAAILSEDRRFYLHAGVDWQAVAAALWGNLLHRQYRGASTLSMQLAGFIDTDSRRGPNGRTWAEKIDQALQAREIERHWSKPQILEGYLNLAPFRGELVGVGALARVMFRKHASGLDMRESALAAALLRGPNAAPAVLERRACELLTVMGAALECRGLGDFISLSLSRKSERWADSESLAPHFARWTLLQAPRQPGESVVSSVDATLQRFVIESADRHLRALQPGTVRDAAVVVLDNATGQMLAYVGSSGGLSDAQNVDHARALRQAGSTLKPFLYSQAIEQKRLTTVSLLNDGPLDLPTGNGLYIPRNYDKQFVGWVSVRTALASSLNIPAVRTLVMVTPDAFQKRLVQLGLPLDRAGDFYGYSLALGSADVSLLTLTNAYRALANQGRYSPVRFLAGAHPPASTEQVIAPDAAWIVGDILSDRHARARTFGLDSPLTTPFWTAVKTGTSKDMRDNWCLGWSERYTVGVWVGNSGGASMRDVSGVSGAGPIWQDVMGYLHRAQRSKQPSRPASVTRQPVTFEDMVEPDRTDVFLGDTAVSRVRLAAGATKTGAGSPTIARPAHGTILALDPDIPADNQRTWLKATGLEPRAAAELQWRVRDTVIGTGSELAWMPRPGKHHIELLDAKGRVVDGVHIEVRGAE